MKPYVKQEYKALMLLFGIPMILFISFLIYVMFNEPANGVFELAGKISFIVVFSLILILCVWGLLSIFKGSPFRITAEGLSQNKKFIAWGDVARITFDGYYISNSGIPITYFDLTVYGHQDKIVEEFELSREKELEQTIKPYLEKYQIAFEKQDIKKTSKKTLVVLPIVLAVFVIVFVPFLLLMNYLSEQNNNVLHIFSIILFWVFIIGSALGFGWAATYKK